MTYLEPKELTKKLIFLMVVPLLPMSSKSNWIKCLSKWSLKTKIVMESVLCMAVYILHA